MPPVRLASLDVLRFVAIALVLGRHSLYLANWEMARLSPGWRTVLEPWYKAGWIGVDLFFVLSGFLVAGLLFRDYRVTGRLAVGRFLIRRAFKIYPGYYLMLAFTAIVLALTRPGPFPIGPFVREALFIQNYWPAVWDHTWSLAVEEHFYLLLPLALVIMRAARPTAADPFRPILAIYVLALLGALVGRGILAWQLPSPRHYLHMTFMLPTHLRIESLLLGAVLAYAYHFHRDRWDRAVDGRAGALAAGGILLLLPAFVFKLDTHAMMYTAGFSVISFGAAMLLAGTLTAGVPDNRAVRAIAFIGRHSYAIYLWHMAVAAWGIRWLMELTGPMPLEGRIVAYFLMSLGVGIALSYAIERPFLWLRDRWFPAHSGRP
ncbi:MAG: acyltransferase [Gemmataceae bacterium]|nr:acyltransferase [Gemmataceae bacterium]